MLVTIHRGTWWLYRSSIYRSDSVQPPGSYSICRRPRVRDPSLSRFEQTKARSTLKSILIIVWSYFALNLPYAILLVAESIGHITRVGQLLCGKSC